MATATRCQEQLRACGGGSRRAWGPCCGGARVWVRSLSPTPTRRPSFRGVVLKRLVQKVVYFGSRVQKVVYFPSDNSDLLSSHFSVQSEVHYFWTASARILVYSQKQSILRACRVCRSHLSKLSQPLIFCFRAQPVQRYCNQSIYPYYCQQAYSCVARSSSRVVIVAV